MAARGSSYGRMAPGLNAASDGDDSGAASIQRGDDELRRMAAFRLRETAKRIGTLAQRAQNEELRRELMAMCERLTQEERRLLDE